MNIADRIQHLRKTKGISQEELADKLGVSRQSVSKWESEQSSPDIEKIILMSDFFEVTTDYLLKGIEPVPIETPSAKEKPNASIFAAAGTAFNCIGLIAAAMIWKDDQTAIATAIGLILMVMGCMIYGVGMTVSDPKSKEKAKQIWWSINIWTLSFIPLSMVHNILTGSFATAPYPVPVHPLVGFALFWIVYITIGVVSTLIVRGRKE
ncbi:MAG: helix-turn-helix domain-containing protein [Faecousia sp.]